MAKKKNVDGIPIEIKWKGKKTKRASANSNIGLKFDTTKLQQKQKRIQEFRKEVSRQAQIANKRIARLEKNKLTDNPAYKKFVESGGHKFGVKGKSYNEVQAELARIKSFIDSKTSTIRGSVQVLREMAQNTGIEYKNLTELKEKGKKFFELASKTEQYLRTVKGNASAVGYQKIWNAINQYTQEQGVNLANTKKSVDEMLEEVTNLLEEYNDPAVITVSWYH